MSRIKAKGKKTRPELSLADKVVYHSMIIVIFVITLFVLFGSMIKTDEYLLSLAEKGDILVYTYGETVPFLCFLLFFTVPCMILYAYLMANVPLFPKKGVEYGKGTYKKYPLFHKYRPKMSESKKAALMEKIKKGAVCAVCMAVCSLILISAFIYPREVLSSDGTLQTYGIFNREKKTYTISDIESAEIISYRQSRTKGPQTYATYKLRMKMTSGKRFEYSARDYFVEHEEILKFLIYLRNTLPDDRLTVEIREDIGNVAKEECLSDAEKLLLYELFDK